MVGIFDVRHIGSHLALAAGSLRIPTRLVDLRGAFEGAQWLARLSWWVGRHRPPRLQAFSHQVVEACKEYRPRWMLSTGTAPIQAGALETIGRMGIQRFNYLTDDPWNLAHRAPWFLRALPLYDRLFSTRRVNIEDLHRLGCPEVSYLPFAYAPNIHYPDPPHTLEERARFDADVVFAGGADRDRFPWIAALIRSKFKVGLYGAYWERFPQTRCYALGLADPPTLRKAIGGAKVTMGLVRRANRDGSSMRTFEVPAMMGCMLTEDTQEHREILGEEGEATVYFRSIPEMVDKLRWLLERPEERQRLAQAAHERILQGKHTYRDRLATMLGLE